MKLQSKYQESKGILTIAIIVLAFAFSYLTISLSDVEVKDDTLNLQGIYGMKVNLSDITEVELKDTLPSGMRRNNGASIAGNIIGNFSSTEMGKVKMSVRGKDPYLYIKIKDNKFNYLIVSFKNPEETEHLYSQLK